MEKLLTKLGIIDIIEWVNKCGIHKERSSKTVGQDSIKHFCNPKGGNFENYHVHKIDFNLAQINFSLSL